MQNERKLRNISLIVISIEVLLVFALALIAMINDEDIVQLPYYYSKNEYYYEILTTLLIFSGAFLFLGLAILLSLFSKIVFNILLILELLLCAYIAKEVILDFMIYPDLDCTELMPLLFVLLFLIPHCVYYLTYINDFFRKKKKATSVES